MWARRAETRSGIRLVENLEDIQTVRSLVDMDRFRANGPEALSSMLRSTK